GRRGAVERPRADFAATTNTSNRLNEYRFDAAAADPLAQMDVTTAGFIGMTERLLGVAARHAGGRVVSVLEGGYDLGALGEGVAAHVGLLLDTAAR
ncbi:MAG: hypothetical protein AAGL98_09190, partial [Planctomycetota bacterium]